MFRARIGNQSSSGNKVLRAKLEAKLKEERERRIMKIKNRKPFSSKVTLDNAPPHIIEAMKTNPRKKALQINFNIVTEQQNMCMLKRISAILTAPPKITDAEYKAMRKLCPTLRGLKEVYEHNIVLEHNKQFFKRLKSIDAYYNAHEWERDYQLQKKGQKFMRQVNYKRPPGFVDPRGLDDPANLQKLASISGSMETREPATNHVNRVRNIKLANAEDSDTCKKSTDSSRRSKAHKSGHSLSSSALGSPQDSAIDSKLRHSASTLPPIGSTLGGHRRFRGVSDNEFGDYETSEFDQLDEQQGDDDAFVEAEAAQQMTGSDEIRIELCSVRRSMHVSGFLTPSDLTEFPPEDLMDHLSPRFKSHGVASGPPVVIVDMDVKCFLVNNVDLVISAVTCQGQPIFVDAEAEAPVVELCALKGIPIKGGGIDPEHHDIEKDMHFIEVLETLAREIAATVEIKVEDEVPRLVLNIFEKKLPFTQDSSDDYYDSEFEGYDTNTFNPDVTNEEVEAMLLEPITLSKELSVKVSFQVAVAVPPAAAHRGSVAYSGAAQAPTTMTKTVIEHLKAQILVTSAKDDKIEVRLVFLQGSETKEAKRVDKKVTANKSVVSTNGPAITAGTELSTSTGMPSIMQADNDLVVEFLENLASSLAVEHNVTTGESKLLSS